MHSDRDRKALGNLNLASNQLLNLCMHVKTCYKHNPFVRVIGETTTGGN